jgi:hypothetical protein
MPVDVVMTQRFVSDPDAFTDKNFVKVRGQMLLSPLLTWEPLGGGVVVDKTRNNVRASISANAMSMVVQQKDCLRIKAIGERPRPTCYVGLEAPQIGTPAVQFYDAHLAGTFTPGYQRIFFLPSRANQLTFIGLPPDEGPSVVMTDALTGCAITVGTINGTQVLCHANAVAIRSNESFEYMHRLVAQLVAQTGMVITASLTKDTYYANRESLEDRARHAKLDLGRTTVDAEAETRTSVFGFRANGVWSFRYLNHATVDSTRTGAAAFFKGSNSHKALVSKHVLLRASRRQGAARSPKGAAPPDELPLSGAPRARRVGMPPSPRSPATARSARAPAPRRRGSSRSAAPQRRRRAPWLAPRPRRPMLIGPFLPFVRETLARHPALPGSFYAELPFNVTHTFDANGSFVVAQDDTVAIIAGSAFRINPFADLPNGPDNVLLLGPDDAVRAPRLYDVRSHPPSSRFSAGLPLPNQYPQFRGKVWRWRSREQRFDLGRGRQPLGQKAKLGGHTRQRK